MNPAGSALLDTNIVVAHFRNDASATAAPAIYVPWIALGELQ
jgi:predicted nucleic acid-binding protein